MKVYLELLKKVLSQGEPKFDRTGTGTRSLFGYQMRINLSSGFPLITTKKLHIRSIVHELLWFLRGETSTKPLASEGVRIWDAWANKDGELGPIYGAQWRSWPASDGSKIDQLEKVINEIRLRPFSRRLLVSAWNPQFLPDETKSPSENVANGLMALAPCHTLFQFSVSSHRLSCHLYQRSADAFIGLPFNIASYALLTHLVAQQCNLDIGDFIWSGGDVHIYENHIQQVKTQLQRKPLNLPRLELLNKPKDIGLYSPDKIHFHEYSPHPHIPAPVAV